MANPGSYTDSGDQEWGVIRRAWNAIAGAFRVVIKGNDGSSYPDVLVDAAGRLQVDIVSGGGGSGGTEFDDGDAIDTTSQGTLILGATAVPGDAHPVKVAADGAVQVDIESAPTLTVQATNLDIRDLSSATDSVSTVVTSSALPSGAATEATLAATLAAVDGLEASATTLIGHVDGVEASLTAIAGSVDGLEGFTDGIEGLLGTSNTNTGNAATSLAIIDDWDESDRAKVNPIVGQAGVAAGAGAVDALTQRTTLASNDPAVTALQIIDDWDESDRAKVNTIAGQVGVQGGSGAVSALTQRVVLATDVGLPAGSAAIGTVTAVGAAAHDAAVSGNPVAVAWEADNSIRPAVSADQEVTRPWADRNGRQVITSMYPGECASQVTTFTTGTAAAVTPNPASTSKLVIYAITVHNSSSTKTTVDFKDGSGGTTVWSLPAAADCGGACQVFPDGLPLTADNDLFADPTTGVSTLTVSVLYKSVVV